MAPPQEVERDANAVGRSAWVGCGHQQHCYDAFPMRLLFVVEGVTLAHSARVSTLVAGLLDRGHEVVAAGVDDLTRFVHPLLTYADLWCIGPNRFTSALRTGSPPYGVADLRRYLDDERRVIDRVRPDAVIADFRPTAVMSARAAGITSASLINAYWSPAARSSSLPMPVLPGTTLLPLRWAQTMYDVGSALVMPLHCRPWNTVRLSMGLGALGNHLRDIYCDADHVLYPDVPGMFDVGPLPVNHHFVGPLLWSPKVDPPRWWPEVDATLPVAYVTLGSSGSAKVLRRVVAALSDDRLSVIVSSAGAVGAAADTAKFGPRTHIAPYLNGASASQRADIVVCNGGSMGCQLAFAFGKPVLGIASNMDQFMNMQGVVAAGAGICLRADRVTASTVRESCRVLLHDPKYATAALAISERQKLFDPIQRVEAILLKAVGRRAAAPDQAQS